MVEFSRETRARIGSATPASAVELPALYDRLTRSQRVKARLQYIDLQQGVCYHCGSCLASNPPDSVLELVINWALFPGERSFLNNPVHLHHSHRTGLTIGAVHAYCNAVLWQYYKE